ncbi:uncharacterized protein LOC128785808 isoform X2 [Vidua chalybeata]|uniref:uncharacterized protein LOC128785808 isoform X2 n=1 Tax=Vidua chalybeata TaxID=81927 RepID=UPI0023A88AAF|nr:uncharacterized protein LOC128785808 isoform X2 [Vidua chalybeata]
MAGRSPGNSGGAAAGDAGRSRYPAIQPARLTTSTQWRLPIRSRRGCHATYLGGGLAQPAVTGAMPKRKLPAPLRARGALRAGSGRAALPPRRRWRRRRVCSALRPAAGSVHCSSAGPRPESGGSGSQRGHPAPAPLNTAGQVRLFLIPSSSHKSTVCGRRAPAAARPAPESPPIALPSRSLSLFPSRFKLSPRRKQHSGAARPAFHRAGGAAAAGTLKTKRRTVTFHTVPFPPRAE